MSGIDDTKEPVLYVLTDGKKYCPGCEEMLGLISHYSRLSDIPIVEEIDWDMREKTTDIFGKRPEGRWSLPALELPHEYKPPGAIKNLIQTTPNGKRILIGEEDIATFFHEEYGIPKRA